MEMMKMKKYRQADQQIQERRKNDEQSLHTGSKFLRSEAMEEDIGDHQVDRGF